jgi:hypothetical protein
MYKFIITTAHKLLIIIAILFFVHFVVELHLPYHFFSLVLLETPSHCILFHNPSHYRKKYNLSNGLHNQSN